MDTTRIKELQARYDAATSETARIDIYVDMAMEQRNTELELADRMAGEIIVRSRTAGYRRGEGRGLNLRGWCHWRRGDYEEGIVVLQQAYAISREIRDRPLEARVLNNFGYIYRDRGDLATALNYFESALDINESLNDEVSHAVNLASIAYIHYDLSDYDNALDFALRCVPAFERAHDSHRLNSVYQILGNIYFKRDEMGEALRYFEENRSAAEPGTVLYALALSGLGKVYYKMGVDGPAEQHLNEALAIAENLHSVEVLITCHYYMGRLNMDKEHFRRARAHFEKALHLSTEYSRRHDEMSIHETMSALYDAIGDIPKAFDHLKTFEKLKEEIFQQTTFNQLRNLQTRQQLELAKKEKEVAEKTAALKQQFLANMSHEIRTPMNAIVGMTRLLLSKSPGEEQKRYLNAIRQSADNLLVIINDILDVSKIEAGKIVIEQMPFQPAEVIRSAYDMLMHKAEEKGLLLETVIDPAIPSYLAGDPTRINQVLINLAGNAIKFTERGSVKIKASLIGLPEDGTRCAFRLDIIDTGIGIPREYVDKIFESFTQAGADTSRKFGGTGLGLTISKQLVELMGGNIFVHSEVGNGTTFSVVLTLPVADGQGLEKETIAVDDASLARLRSLHILLVEDNEFNRMVAEDTLAETLPGIRVDVALNGQEAVEKSAGKAYDLILMDIQMPVMDGLEAAKTIRSREQASGAQAVPIIAMTANVLQDDIAKYLAIGMNAHLAKPFQQEELLGKMNSVLAPAVAAAKTEVPAAAAAAVLPPLPDRLTDMAFLRGLTGGNSERMEKYKGMFLENAPRLLEAMDRALESGDLPALKIAAHSLKPQLGYMGVQEEISNIYLIEQTAGGAGHPERLPALLSNLHRVCSQVFSELR